MEIVDGFLTVNYFYKKSSIVDIRHASKYAYVCLMLINEVQFKFLCKVVQKISERQKIFFKNNNTLHNQNNLHKFCDLTNLLCLV